MVKRREEALILLVDDDREGRHILRIMLEKERFMVEEAGNGKEALEKIAGRKPDIVLLDGLMPVMDGFETCRRLRENPETKDISIIFCTATHILEVKSKKVKVDDYIEKPFPTNELLHKIGRILQKKE